MKMSKKIASAVAKITKAMADKGCNSASMWGTYQPKEPTSKK